MEEREKGGDADGSHGRGPGMAADQIRSDPPRSGEEIAEAEPPPGREGGQQPAEPSSEARPALEEPDECGKGEKAGDREVERGQRQGREGADEEGDEPPRPPPQQNYPPGKSLHRSLPRRRIRREDLAAGRARSK